MLISETTWLGTRDSGQWDQLRQWWRGVGGVGGHDRRPKKSHYIQAVGKYRQCARARWTTQGMWRGTRGKPKAACVCVSGLTEMPLVRRDESWDTREEEEGAARSWNGDRYLGFERS